MNELSSMSIILVRPRKTQLDLKVSPSNLPVQVLPFEEVWVSPLPNESLLFSFFYFKNVCLNLNKYIGKPMRTYTNFSYHPVFSVYSSPDFHIEYIVKVEEMLCGFTLVFRVLVSDKSTVLVIVFHSVYKAIYLNYRLCKIA